MAPLVNNLPAMRETRVQFLGREVLLEKGLAIHSWKEGRCRASLAAQW